MFAVNYKEVKTKIVKLFSDRYFVSAFLIFILGTFLRFWRLPEFVTFLGDQGRDAIILKRIITLEHLPAIGAPTSVGQVYLGPFYYYFIAPWLAIFRFDPVGPAIAVAFFSSLYILINYLAVKQLFNRKIALISTTLVAFSTVIIENSRYSWNPNLLPLFTFLTIYFFIKSWRSKKIFWTVAAGAFLSFTIQLHYLALFLIPPLILSVLISGFKNESERMALLKKSLISFASFLFFSLPLLIFDLRHGFLNTRSFINFFKSPSGAPANKFINLFSTFSSLNKFTFNTDISFLIVIILFILIIAAFFTTLKKRETIAIYLLFFIFLIGGLTLYSGPKYPHYFGSVYPVYFIIIAYFLSFISFSRVGTALIIFFSGIFIFLNFQGYFFLKGAGSNQIVLAKDVARVIENNLTSTKYNLTSLPQSYSDFPYRYFLEVWGKKPIEKDGLEKGAELFAVCETDCQVMGDPGWDVASFAPTKLIGSYHVKNVRIFKLTR